MATRTTCDWCPMPTTATFTVKVQTAGCDATPTFDLLSDVLRAVARVDAGAAAVSQFVWTCKACDWRTTAENASLGVRGEAPTACRRCSKTAFSVTSEKHPRVTLVCKNKECRADYTGTWGTKYCPKCRDSERSKRMWEGRQRKYVWTPERDQILKDHYNHNPTEIAARFFPGWEKWVISHRAQALGLCRVKEKPWTKAEDAFIREHAGTRTAHWMAKQLRTRTITAIVVRLKRLNISRRIQADGLTLGQLEQATGVDHRQIVGWFRSGRLKGSYKANPNEHERYEFQEPDIARFLLDNPSLFRLDRVDQAWFMTLMREAVRGERGADEPTAVVDEKPQATKPRRARAVAVAQVPETLTMCVGVDDKTPCPQRKQVAAKPHIPARCPDCKLELKRRLHREEMERLQRIRSVSAPHRASA